MRRAAFRRLPFGFMLVLFQACLILPLAFSQPKQAPEKEKYGGTLRVAITKEDKSLDARYMSGRGWENAPGFQQMYERVVEYAAPGSGQSRPLLAEKIEQLDEVTWLVRIKKGVKFHHGRELTAEDVYSQIGWGLKTPQGWRAIRHRSCLDLIKGMDLVDKYTLKFTLKQPSVLFPTYSLMWSLNGGAEPPELVEKYGKSFTNNPVGTGPFKFVEQVPKEKIILEKNPNYWGGEEGKIKDGKRMPKYDRLLLTVVPDPTTRRIMLEKGEIDIAGGLPTDVVEDLKKVPDIKVVTFPLLYFSTIYMNCSKKPFDDLRVRQALAYAVDTDMIIRDIERGMVLPSYGTIPKGMLGYDEKRLRYKRDVQRAKKLLAEAGYPNGFSTSLIYSPERRSEFEQESVLIQSFFKEIGVDVRIEKMAYTAQLARQVAGTHELTLMTLLAGTGDPSSLNDYYFPAEIAGTSPNYSFRWKNDRVIELLNKGMTLPDSPERAKIYSEIDDIGMKEAVTIPLYQMSSPYAVRNNVSGLKYDTLRRIVLWEVVKK